MNILICFPYFPTEEHVKHVEGWIAGAKSGVGTWGEGSSEGGRSVGNWEAGSVNSISGTRQWEQG